jgi:radical SAM enzyme (TIGR01210 family)
VHDEVEAVDVLGAVADVTTILLRGSECSFRCTMCDLWKSTHLGPTPAGILPAQIQSSLVARPSVRNNLRQRWIKLYNASNFFAPYNVPTEDLPAIASLVSSFDRVVVENHPLLTSQRIQQFAAQLHGRLEVAMGLETVESAVLASLNKQVTVEDIRRATLTLVDQDIDVRLFVLLRPPGLSEVAAIETCLASIEAAREWGARHVSVIPLRGGNGALEHLQRIGHFEPPLASSLEGVLNSSLAKSPMVITADTWDWSRLRGLCSTCSNARLAALERANLTQAPHVIDRCNHCQRF